MACVWKENSLWLEGALEEDVFCASVLLVSQEYSPVKIRSSTKEGPIYQNIATCNSCGCYLVVVVEVGVGLMLINKCRLFGPVDPATDKVPDSLPTD